MNQALFKTPSIDSQNLCEENILMTLGGKDGRDIMGPIKIADFGLSAILVEHKNGFGRA